MLCEPSELERMCSAATGWLVPMEAHEVLLQTDGSRGAAFFRSLAQGRFPWHRVMRLMIDLDLALQKAGQRRRLLELDDDQLSDIGITREDAVREARKGFWR